MARINAPIPVKRKARLLNNGCYALRPAFKDRTFPVIVNVSHVSRSGNLAFVNGEDLAALGFWIKDPLTGEREIELLD